MFREMTRTYIVAFTLLSLVTIFPAEASAYRGYQHYVTGKELMAAGHYADAAASFKQAIDENPDHIMARYHLGLIYLKNILTIDQAERIFLDLPEAASHADSLSRNDIFFLSGLALGKVYIKSGRHRKAIQLIRSVLTSASPGSPLDDAHNTFGLALYYERLYEDAIFEFQRALKINPENKEARFNLKTIRARLEHYNAGKIYSRMGERKEAIAQFRKAIELDPRFVEARIRLGMELLLYGDSALALKELKRAESISSNYRKAFEIWYAEGLALLSLGRNDEAMSMFVKTIDSRPNFAAAHNEVGKILLEKGEYESAIPFFIRAIGIDPKTEYIRNMLLATTKKGK